jgi:hypothetical protein
MGLADETTEALARILKNGKPCAEPAHARKAEHGR